MEEKEKEKSVFEWVRFLTKDSDKYPVEGKWKIVNTDDPNLTLEKDKWYGNNQN